MREQGMFSGIALAYTQRQPSFWKVEGRFSYGQVDYTGSTWGGTSLYIQDIDNYIFEIRGIKGLRRQNAPEAPTNPYIGFGYRYLRDEMSDRSAGGYLRESNYIYLPIGIERKPEGGKGWSAGFNLEYDLFLMGKQISYFSDIDPNAKDAENTQKKGYGFRGSIQFMNAAKKNLLIIEPYFRYWNIKESDLDFIGYDSSGWPVYVVEPDNEHRELGMRFLLRF